MATDLLSISNGVLIIQISSGRLRSQGVLSRIVRFTYLSEIRRRRRSSISGCYEIVSTAC